MTKRVPVGSPDNAAAYIDVAERAAAALGDQASPAAVTEAILKAIGFPITEDGKARWR